MKRKTGNLDTFLDLKDADLKPDGSFKGYGSVFGNVDSYNEIVPKGAFKASLKEWAKRGALPALLWQHRSDSPIGVYTKMVEDDHGLYVEGQLILETRQGAEAYALLKAGALNGLSIGYACTEWTTDKKTGTTTLDVIDLWEVSLVTFPANGKAVIDSVKYALEDGDAPPITEFERLLREAGYSKRDATLIASHGYRKYLDQREAETNPAPLAFSDTFLNRYST